MEGSRIAAGQPGSVRAGLTPVGRQSLQDKVYAELRRSLIHGVFNAGEVLRMQDLADMLDVSIMPVREALGRLVSERALEALPNRSVRVPLITLGRVDDLLRARLVIEGELVRLALPRLGPADIAGLRALVEAGAAASAPTVPERLRAMSESNHAFHFAIYEAAGSAVFLPIAESLWLQSGPYLRQAVQIFLEDPAIEPLAYHRELVEALAAGDAGAAVAALGRDISQSLGLIRARLAAAAEAEA
jgi:DNA-binding GntR family transcriptional regulator